VSASGQNLPAGHVPIPASASPDAPTVVVLETMAGGGYTYVRTELNGKEAWLAGPQTALAVGDTVLASDPMPMGTFTSRALGRTFDELYFVGGFVTPGASGRTAAAPPAGGPEGEALEVLSSGGYTYVRVETDGESVWIAGPPASVEQGNTVSWRAGSPMRDFTSRTLGRTFDEILFVQEIFVVR
jgi:hypothetical protein